MRRRRLGIAGLALGLVGTLVPLLSPAPASADTPTASTVTATTSTQTNVAPSVPLTGLTNGQTVTIRVTEAGGADIISGIQTVRQCKPGLNITAAAQLVPSNNGNCLSAPLQPGTNNARGPFVKAQGSDNFIEFTFNVGVGTQQVTFDNGSGNQNTTITCDASSPCALWMQIQRPGGSDYVHYDLNFLLGTPGAPTAAAATCTATGANVSWTPPTNFGGTALLDHYTVTATPTGGGAAVAPVQVSGTTTSTPVVLTTAFSPYDISVTATNTGGNTGPASNVVTGVQTCITAAPVLLAPAVGAGQVDLSWTYGGPTAGLTGYQVRLQRITPAGADVVVPAVGNVLTQHIGGLTDGQLYRASVHALYGTGSSAESNAQDFAPVSTLITQTITVRRPQGALVLTQVCTKDGNPVAHAPTVSGGGDDPLYAGYPYPQDALTGDSLASYPTNCGIALGNAHLLTADDPTVPGDETGNFFEATGSINQVTVVDTRDVSPTGWTVNGSMASFTDPASHVISGDELGWTPALTYHSAPFTDSSGVTYTNAAVAGAPVLPNRLSSSGTGLGASTGQQLGSAPATGRLGIARYDAALKLWIPVTARTGNYTGVLTISAI
jgi:hypothetical protein